MKSTPDHELSLHLQAWIDGELDAPAARRIAARVEREPELREQAERLRQVSALLRDNPPVRTVPEPRDFYWSRIRQGIERTAPTAPTASSGHPGSPLRWLGWLLPAGAAALAAILLFRPLPPMGSAGLQSPALTGHEIDTPSGDLSSLTYYASQDGMTVVWLGRIDLL